MAGYVRNDTSNNIATGNIINASDLDGEFDAIQAAFVNTTGHTHDGTAAEGAPITKVGPAQDIVVAAGATTPKTNNVMDLGSSGLKFKDIYAAGTAYIATLDLTNALTVADGGTGATTLTGLVKGNGASAFSAAVAGTDFPGLSTSNTFTAAQTFRAANSVRAEAASTQDAMVLAGRAGGTSSFAVTLTPATLSASRTVTFPDSNTNIPIASQTITFSGPTAARTYTLPDSASTLAALGTAQTFTAAQTFRAANAVRSEAASTQDAVVLAGRAGGTGSFAVTLTPATLASNTTLTLPNVNDTLATLGTAQTFTANQTIQSNLIFSGASRRIQGDFSNVDTAQRPLFQSSTTNGQTVVGAIPNGTSTGAYLAAYNNSGPSNAGLVYIGISNASAFLESSKTGTGTTLPLDIQTNGALRTRFGELGGVDFSTGLREARVTMGSSDIDVRAGNYFTRTISGTTTFTVSNVPTSGTAASFILDLTNGGSATINWWSGVKWASGTAPTLTAAGRDVLGFFTHDGGTTWTGLLLGKDVK